MYLWVMEAQIPTFWTFLLFFLSAKPFIDIKISLEEVTSKRRSPLDQYVILEYFSLLRYNFEKNNVFLLPLLCFYFFSLKFKVLRETVSGR
jgi:hypothetical protein